MLLNKRIAEPRYGSVEDMLARLAPSNPVMCFRPDRIAANVATFLQHFPGKVLYAVKCNPHPLVLDAIYRSGLRNFDTASLKEIALVNELFPDVSCYFNHPVKGRAAIHNAYRVYGVRDFVIDHPAELAKVINIAGAGVVIQVRLRTPGGVAKFDLSAKFGADAELGIELLREVERLGARPAISFHVGSQCLVPGAYTNALQIVADVIDRAGVAIEYVNVGGGFPACGSEQSPPPVDVFIAAIRDTAEQLGFAGKTPLLCEPGRALVADGASQIVQVHLRKGDRLYLNDGVFGCLSELVYAGMRPPMRAIRLRGKLSEEIQPFTLFGPTCDSGDVAPQMFDLPADIDEGDWIEVELMGAYSNALQSNFNGFSTENFVTIAGPQAHP